MLKLENMFENFDLVREALAFWAHVGVLPDFFQCGLSVYGGREGLFPAAGAGG